MLLTPNIPSAILAPLSKKTKVGREKPVFNWRKVAAFIRGFFMPVIQRGLVPYAICYGGLFWEAFGPIAPVGGFLTPFQPATHAVRSIGGGYSNQLESPL
ncbi:hypothetical protein U737_09640 [Methylomonas sp. LW13]|uniref:hypothetical protein n=1 Tax=unclassified Methylomonas TaxID=2608980 RepID=UPI00051AABF7|nr:hypothetical protein [Methylomonas sp. LW13]QBC27142.1 hypothetical protein U737_09640 [Methylomonas sp. LW13]